MKKLMKLFAVAPLALALVFGGLVAASSDETPEGNADATAELDKKPATEEDAEPLEKEELKQTDWLVTLVDNINMKVINKNGAFRIEKGFSSVEAAKEYAAKVYGSSEEAASYFAGKGFMGAKLVKTEANGGEHKIQLYFEPTQEKLTVLHQLLLCDGKVDLNQPILTEIQWVPFKTDYESVELKKLPYTVLNQVSSKAWTLVAIKYVNSFNDSPVVKYVDLKSLTPVTVRNLDTKGKLVLSYKLSSCPKDGKDAKVDAASDEEKKEEKKDDAKQDEKKSLPATGSSSSVLVFLSAAVLLGAGLVLVKKH